MKGHTLLILLVCICFSGCGDTYNKPETLIPDGYDEKEMESAIARAKAEVDLFIAELAKPTGQGHAVKVPITDGEQTEHFWMNEVSYREGHFEGTINNEPGLVSNVRIGDKRKVARAEISDWMYMRDGKMHGNYTMRPLLKTLPKAEADYYRSILAEP